MALPDMYDEARVGKQKQGQAVAFEFTRRKRWADTLVSEAPELAIFILSKSGTIWYAGPAVGELLGWKVGELIDKDVSHILNDDDLNDFREDLERCASSSEQLFSYARLKCRSSAEIETQFAVQKELLYELRGKFVAELSSGENVFFILTAKPYPSKNMAIINTMLELKIEHEMLSQRLAELRLVKAQRGSDSSAAPKSAPQAQAPRYSQLPRAPYSSSEFRHYSFFPGDETGSFEPEPAPKCEDEDDGFRTRKRPFSPDHQFVCFTCGRTDSPEWRKGPNGPKTLCNACGLRWAKRAKKGDRSRDASSSDKKSFQEPSSSTQAPKPLGSRKSISSINPPAPHPALRCTPPSALVTTSTTGSVYSPSPLSTSSLATVIDSSLLSQPQTPGSPQDFLLPPPSAIQRSQPGQTPYSSLQHALASEQSSHPPPAQRVHFPHLQLPSWSSTARNAYGY